MDLTREDKVRELESLRNRVQSLEAEIAKTSPEAEWPPRSYYTVYHVLAGFVLGGIGAMASLLFNVIGALFTGKHPLELIRVYLTFPFGESALTLDSSAGNGGLLLALGCCLYLLTGMFLGIPFQLLLTKWYPQANFGARFLVTSVLAIALWALNFYGILSWLQPLLLGGRWIVELIPPWVAALTHLVFGWSMLLMQPLGKFIAPHSTAEVS